MLSPEEQRRYSKQIILPEVRLDGQELLAATKVLVIGAGGLGCPVLQYLTAAGVGKIGIADGDKIDLTNLQRQVLYTEQEIGKPKAEVAAGKLNALNPNIRIHTHPVFIDKHNAIAIISEYDIVVDGSDNFATRYLINDACVILRKPLVSGAIYKFEGQVTVLNYNDGPTYRCIFPEPPGEGESPNCADIGVIATLPGIIGSIQANEVIKIITGIGEVLSGKLLVIDTLTMNSHTFSFKAVEANKRVTSLGVEHDGCARAPGTISYHELKSLLQSNNQLLLVDVREVEEHEMGNIGGINIPLSSFATEYSRIDPMSTVVLYCASGVRSNNAAKQLAARGYTHVLNLEGGVKDLL